MLVQNPMIRYFKSTIFNILAVMNRMITQINNLTQSIGKIVSWFSILLIIIIIVDVFFRYSFNITTTATFEIEWHLFGLMFMLGAAWTLEQDKHVRVDLFYQSFGSKTKALINLFGTLLLLIPFCWVGMVESIDFVTHSYAQNETSPDPGGLPARYLIKATIPLGFALLLLQGISLILTSIKTLIR